MLRAIYAIFVTIAFCTIFAYLMDGLEGLVVFSGVLVFYLVYFGITYERN